MIAEYHSFVDGQDGHCGAILRHLQPGRVLTRTVFTMDDAAVPYLVDHLIAHDGDVHHWTRFRYDSPTSGSRHEGTRDQDGGVRVAGQPVPALSGAVPSYAEHLLVTELVAGVSGSMSYVQFDEAATEHGPQAAELHRAGRETTELEDGTKVEAERVQLVVAGRPTNTHWCIDGLVVKSDWCGAQSFLVDDVERLLDGLRDEVATAIRQFAGPPGRDTPMPLYPQISRKW